MIFILAPDISEIIKALTHLVEVLVANFGALGTIIIVASLLLVAFLWRRYNDYRRDKATNDLLAEKDRTIQRLAEEARNFKILHFKEKLGWTDEQITLFIMKNEFVDGVTARKALEGEKPSVKIVAKEPTAPEPRSRRRGKGSQR
jgi:hypothetical protein